MQNNGADTVFFLFVFFLKQNDAETTGHSHGKKWIYKFIPFTKINSK